MPELPEVETVSRNIAPHITNKTISGCAVYWQKTVEQPSATEFSGRIVNQTVLRVGRRAKYIVIDLSKDSLLIHLRMSGDLLYSPTPHTTRPHDRVTLQFTDGSELAFNDPRKFGRVWLVADPASVTGKLGPEPLSEDFTLGIFSAIIGQSDRNIKAFLLDQTMIAGLGNIYTDEALYLAGILPTRKTSTLNPSEVSLLYNAIRNVLNEGIRNNGASFDWVYRGGHFQNNFNVYKRAKLPCKGCGTQIIKTTLQQRGTHYCPNCQK